MHFEWTKAWWSTQTQAWRVFHSWKDSRKLDWAEYNLGFYAVRTINLLLFFTKVNISSNSVWKYFRYCFCFTFLPGSTQIPPQEAHSTCKSFAFSVTDKQRRINYSCTVNLAMLSGLNMAKLGTIGLNPRRATCCASINCLSETEPK